MPKRYRKTTLDRIEQYAISEDVSMYKIISMINNYPELSRVSKKLQGFFNFIENMKVLAARTELVELIELLIDKSGIVKELETEMTVESRTRIENIKEFVSVAREFELTAEEKPTLEDFLAHISLVADIDDTKKLGIVVVMTLHSAKGLEFPVVFIAGMEEEYSSYRSSAEEEELEEERQLLCRNNPCQEEVYLTNAKCRMLFEVPLITVNHDFKRDTRAAHFSNGECTSTRKPRRFQKRTSLCACGKVMDLSDLKARIKAFNRLSYDMIRQLMSEIVLCIKSLVKGL